MAELQKSTAEMTAHFCSYAELLADLRKRLAASKQKVRK